MQIVILCLGIVLIVVGIIFIIKKITGGGTVTLPGGIKVESTSAGIIIMVVGSFFVWYSTTLTQPKTVMTENVEQGTIITSKFIEGQKRNLKNNESIFQIDTQNLKRNAKIIIRIRLDIESVCSDLGFQPRLLIQDPFQGDDYMIFRNVSNISNNNNGEIRIKENHAEFPEIAITGFFTSKDGKLKLKIVNYTDHNGCGDNPEVSYRPGSRVVVEYEN